MNGDSDGIAAAVARLDEDGRALVAEFVAELAAPRALPGLSPQESRIVRTLQAARGRVLSKPFIASAIAPDPSDPPGHRSVDVLVGRIRRRRPDIGRCIAVVWGEGLRWRAPGTDTDACLRPGATPGVPLAGTRQASASRPLSGGGDG